MDDVLMYFDNFKKQLIYAFKIAPNKRKKLFYLAAIWAVENLKKGLIREVIEK